MFDKLFFVVLVLNATGLFSFVAPILDVSIKDVSIALLAVNLCYLAVKVRYSSTIIRNGGLRSLLIAFLIWPFLTLIYAPSLEIRSAGVQLYYFTLLYCAVVYTVAKGLVAMHRVLSISLIITIIGLILGMVAPNYFEAVSELADAKFMREERASGFILQPNSLAISINLLFIGWFALWQKKNTLEEPAIMMVFILAILLTGSRIGMAIAIFIIFFVLTYSWKRKFMTKINLLKLSVLILCLVVGIAGMRYYLSKQGSANVFGNDLITRIEMMLNFRFSEESGHILDTGSAQIRLYAQTIYWNLFKEKLILGHGFGSEVYYQEKGLIFFSSHSDALTCAMQYGVFYPVIFILLFLQLYRRRNRNEIEMLFCTNSISQFVFSSIVMYLIAGSLMGSRTLYIVWGMFLATVYYPRYAFSSEEGAKRLNGFKNYHNR